MPVSAARAERDAIAAAATAGALRRQNRGGDPTQRARHIAAALNVGIFDFGFFWYYDEEPDVVRIHGLVIHPGKHEVYAGGQPILLTYTEFGILNLLAKRPGWVF
ncbi:MAG: hypothetical protein SW019_22025, partial [Actinomycetota bacterium]|nr:hypothetical protein [Actinomycetota bacterium]